MSGEAKFTGIVKDNRQKAYRGCDDDLACFLNNAACANSFHIGDG
jgi:hypothetical protein